MHVALVVDLCLYPSRGFSYFPYKMENFLYVAFVSFSTHAKWLFSPLPSLSHLIRIRIYSAFILQMYLQAELCFGATAMFVRSQPQNFARIFPKLRGIFFIFLPETFCL